MKINIRKAKKEDSRIIAEMVEALATYEKLGSEAKATEEQFHKFGFEGNPFFEVLLAESDTGDTVGFALYFYTFSTFEGFPTLKLEDLFVKPEFRRHSIGQQLLQQLALAAVEKGCARMEWDVLDWNELAISFYRKLGAAPLDGWKTFRIKGEPLQKLAGKL